MDVYRISDGKYVGIFYLPKFKGQKIRDLKKFPGGLVVLYEDGYCAIFPGPPKLN